MEKNEFEKLGTIERGQLAQKYLSDLPKDKENLTRIRDEVILELYQSGAGISEVAGYLRMPRSSVYHVLDKHGVLTKPLKRERLTAVQRAAIETMCGLLGLTLSELVEKCFNSQCVPACDVKDLTFLEAVALIKYSAPLVQKRPSKVARINHNRL